MEQGFEAISWWAAMAPPGEAAGAAGGRVAEAQRSYAAGRFAESLQRCGLAMDEARSPAQLCALHAHRAVCLLKMEDYGEGIEECERALECDPDSLPALQLRAEALQSLKQYGAALSDVARILRLLPGSEQYMALQARLEMQLARPVGSTTHVRSPDDLESPPLNSAEEELSPPLASGPAAAAALAAGEAEPPGGTAVDPVPSGASCSHSPGGDPGAQLEEPPSPPGCDGTPDLAAGLVSGERACSGLEAGATGRDVRDSPSTPAPGGGTPPGGAPLPGGPDSDPLQHVEEVIKDRITIQVKKKDGVPTVENEEGKEAGPSPAAAAPAAAAAAAPPPEEELEWALVVLKPEGKKISAGAATVRARLAAAELERAEFAELAGAFQRQLAAEKERDVDAGGSSSGRRTAAQKMSSIMLFEERAAARALMWGGWPLPGQRPALALPAPLPLSEPATSARPLLLPAPALISPSSQSSKEVDTEGRPPPTLVLASAPTEQPALNPLAASLERTSEQTSPARPPSEEATAVDAAAVQLASSAPQAGGGKPTHGEGMAAAASSSRGGPGAPSGAATWQEAAALLEAQELFLSSLSRSKRASVVEQEKFLERLLNEPAGQEPSSAPPPPPPVARAPPAAARLPRTAAQPLRHTRRSLSLPPIAEVSQPAEGSTDGAVGPPPVRTGGGAAAAADSEADELAAALALCDRAAETPKGRRSGHVALTDAALPSPRAGGRAAFPKPPLPAGPHRHLASSGSMPAQRQPGSPGGQAKGGAPRLPTFRRKSFSSLADLGKWE